MERFETAITQLVVTVVALICLGRLAINLLGYL